MIDFPFFAGVAASVLHVVSGPDHLAAVTPLAIETRRKVWKIGLFWGFGHLIGMLCIGLLFLLFKEYIPLHEISDRSEQLVGIVLIAVGLWALYHVFKKNDHHKHFRTYKAKDAYLHKHIQSASSKEHSRAHGKKEKQNLWSSLVIGVLHGLAGIAHFILLLPILGFENQSESLQYIVGFGLGTVLAMTSYTFLLNKMAYILRKQNNSIFRTIRLSGGLFALVIGIYWMYISF